MEKHTELLLSTEFSDELIENPVFQELIERTTEFSKDCNIVGYHYTKANKEDILKEGLKSRSGQEIREIFLSRYSGLFTVEELETIKKLWDAYFDKIQKSSRDNYIFFNLTTEALSNSGAEPLLKYYGGEQVYMPLQREFTIAQKLRGIGTPLLIKAILDPKQLSNFYEDDIVKIAISSYHRTKRMDANQYDCDVYQRHPISPSQIEIICF